MKKLILLFALISALLVGCKNEDIPQGEQKPIEKPITSYQLEFNVFDGLFDTPSIYKGILGGATCYAYFTYRDVIINEMTTGNQKIKTDSFASGVNEGITKTYKSDKYVANVNTEYLIISFNVDLNIYKGDGNGVSRPTMYRTIPVKYELQLYKGQTNIYKVTCGSKTNVLMIGGETARIDTW